MSYADASASRNSFTGLVTSDYDVYGINAEVNVSYDFLLDDNGYFAPIVGVQIANYSTDEFTEVGGLGLAVDIDDTNFLEASAGVITGREFDLGDRLLDTYARAEYVYDLTGNSTEVNASFGNQSLDLVGLRRDDQRVELGAGFNIHSGGSLSFGASVDGELAGSFVSVGGTLRLKMSF